MASKTTAQTFTNDWRKTLSWAQSNSIPKSSVLAVYNMDLHRLDSGYTIMSPAERYRAIMATSGRGHGTVLPTTYNQGGLGNIINNARNTLGNIFTGLNPVGLVENLFHTVKNTIEHPETTIKELLGTHQAIETVVKHPTKSALAEFVPGLLDVYRVEATGLKGLTNNPISSLLDIASVGSIAGGLLKAGGVDLAEKAATATGVAVEDLGKDSVYRNVGRIVGAKKNPFTKQLAIKKLPTGELLQAPETISQTLQRWTKHYGLGYIPSHLMEGALTGNQRGTFLSKQALEPIVNLFNTMPDDHRAMVLSILRKTGEFGQQFLDKTIEQILTTDRLPLDVKNAIRLYNNTMRERFAEYALSTDKVTNITLPTGRQFMYSSTTAEVVERAHNKVTDALAELEDRRQEGDKFATRGAFLDTHLTSVLGTMNKLQQTLWSYMVATIPTESSEVSGMLKDSLSMHTGNATQSLLNHLYKVGNEDRIYRTVTRSFPAKRSTPGEEPLKIFHQVTRTKAPLTITNARTLVNIFKPGGIIDQIRGAYTAKNFKLARDTARRLTRILNTAATKELVISAAPQLLDQLRAMAKETYELAKERKTNEDSFTDVMMGRTAKTRKTSIPKLLAKYNAAMEGWTNAVKDNYPPVYRSVYLDILTRKIIEHEKTPEFLREASDQLQRMGWSKESIDKLGSTPRNFLELLSTISSTTYDDPLVGQVLPSIKDEVENSAKKELAELRARPTTEAPIYVPAITSTDLRGLDTGKYDIYLPSKLGTDPGISATHERQLFDYGPSVNNFLAAVTVSTKEQITRDGVLEYHDNFLRPLSYTQGQLQKMILGNPARYAEKLTTRTPLGETPHAALEDIYRETLGLVKWNPDELFGFTTGRVTPGDDNQLWIDKTVKKVLDSIVTKNQFPMHGVLDKVTNLFRFSVLGLSPRFFLHVSVGGTYLLAGKINPMTFRYIGKAFSMVKNGTLDDQVMHSLTQEGNEYVAYHYMAGRSFVKLSIENRLKSMGIDPKYAAIATWVKAAANINYTLTRFIGNMQRALAYFDGIEKSAGRGSLIDVLDENGRLDKVTTERALYEGRKSVARVMGDLRSMSPFERQWMTKIMPFYGWNKHVIKYILSMPIDHPFRAQIFANMAEANSQDVQQGLPTRIQLLFFLGSPTENGTVSAITDRFSDPLRTVANYASLSGVISSLNPVATAAFSYIDPEIVYGSNTLYPKTTYTHLFGVESGKAAGSLVTAAEQIVPEIGAIDTAFGLSEQYRGLAKRTPGQFKKDIFEALNIPFAYVQHLNLKQIAAKDEIDKYHVAEQAATTALKSGTFKGLKGYKTATLNPRTQQTRVPLPLNDTLQITPEQLKALYTTTMQSYGLPPQDVLREPKSPPLL